MKHLVKLLLIVFMLAYLVVPLVAKEETAVTELALFGEGLVSIAARSEETLLNCSGTVYVIDENEIKLYGWRDLKEILAAVPNMDLTWTWSWMWGGQRGFVGSFSGTLLLIDGREVQNGIANEAFMCNNFPAQRIKRIEILQGPNSTLYGGNATQGVINIVTKSGDKGDQDLAETSLLYGQASTSEVSGVFKRKTENAEIGFSASNFKSKQNWQELKEFWIDPTRYSLDPGYDKFATNDTNLFRNQEVARTLDAYARYKDFYLGYNYFGFVNDFGIEFIEYDKTSDTDTRDTHLVYMGVNRKITDNLKYMAEVQYSAESDDFTFQGATIETTDTSYADIATYVKGTSFGTISRPRFITQADWLLNKTHNIIVGLDWWQMNFDHLRDQNNVIHPQPIGATINASWPVDMEKNEKVSAFAQDIISLVEDKLKLTLGLRFNKQDYTNDSWLPRASLVYQPTTNSALKMTYGKAFRPPAILEFMNVIDKTIDSQVMEMYELNYSQNVIIAGLKGINILSGYTMKASNLYNRVYDPNIEGSVQDKWRTVVAGSFFVRGVEDQLKITYKNLSGMLGMRWIHPTSEIDTPKTKSKLGVGYKFTDYFQTSVFVDHWAKVTADRFGGGTYDISAQDQVDLNLIFGEFNIDQMKANLNIYVKNVFDADIYTVNTRGADPVQFYQYPRDIRVQLTTTF